LPEPTGSGDVPPWLEPYPDVLLDDLDDLDDQHPGPEVRYESAEAISLAFVTALQLLPPRQRAVLVLRDVQGYHAAEVAEMLDATPEAVSRALILARATVDTYLAGCGGGSGGPGSARRPDPAAENRLVAGLTDALERADLDAVLALLGTDVRLCMPPAMLEHRGIESARHVLATVTFRPGRSYRVVPTRANCQPALGLYIADPHGGIHRAYCLLVITTAGDHISALTSFTAHVMAHFGLPRILPDAD
jgi:RNA polymerase sigma-70 factor (ECF subfamily)